MIQCGKRLHAQTTFYDHRVDFYLSDFGTDGKLYLVTP